MKFKAIILLASLVLFLHEADASCCIRKIGKNDGANTDENENARKIFKAVWERPKGKYPKIWHTFEDKDKVKYRIQDLPESRFNDAVDVMARIYCASEPMCEAYNVITERDSVEDYKRMWRSILHQKSSFVCMKEGSNEIIGLSINLVCTKDDPFLEEIRKLNQGVKRKNISGILKLLYADFNPYQRYGVENYLTSIGLIVDDKYRGKGIGKELLQDIEPFCREFGIKLTSSIFTSDFSNKCADEVGMELNVVKSYDQIRIEHREFNLPTIKSKDLTVKSRFFN